jgi:hypothetical protein
MPEKPTLTTRSDGTQSWYLNELLHREDGPAIIYPDGTQYWFLNDQLHREGGPAITWANGTQEWWVRGERVEPLISVYPSRFERDEVL